MYKVGVRQTDPGLPVSRYRLLDLSARVLWGACTRGRVTGGKREGLGPEDTNPKENWLLYFCCSLSGLFYFVNLKFLVHLHDFGGRKGTDKQLLIS